MKRIVSLAVLVIVCVGLSQAQTITSAKSGAWSSDTTWVGGVVPTAVNNVVIDTGMTVSLNAVTAECNNLDVNGTLAFIDAAGLALTVNGNMTIGFKGTFNTAQTNSVTTARAHTITLYKDLTVIAGGKIDMRRGSGALVGVGRVIFAGTSNSTISLTQTSYASTIEEFNSVVINKTGGAKVILASGNLYQNNNSTNSADTLLFISGMIETGNNMWIHLATTAAGVTGASPTSYVNGILGRGLSNSAGSTRRIDVGDSTGYRPVTIQTTVSGVATGHHVWAKVFLADANTGSSVLNGGIDKISKVRYTQVGYNSGGTGAATMNFCRFSPTYGTDDGVAAGNQDLRVAFSSDSRATWKNLGPTTDTTSLTAPPTLLRSDSLAPNHSIPSGQSIFVAVSRVTGTTTNSLEGVVPAPQFSLNSKSFNFGSIKINTTKSDSVMITNNGNAALSVSSILSTSIDFQVLTSSVNVNPGSSVYVKITFMPVTVGGKSGSIIIIHNAGAGKDTVTVSGTAAPATSVNIENSLPTTFAVLQNYPNPFNPNTTITYQLPLTSSAVISVYDVLGKEVATLVNETKEAGVHTVQFDASNISSGIYFYSLRAGNFVEYKKMLLVK